MTTNVTKGRRRKAFRFGLALCIGALAFQALAGARETVAFVCGHPDDLAGWSGTALLLAKRYDVHVIDYTHGERGLGEPGYRDGSTRKLRTKEEENVCAAIGATLHWLDEIDGEASVPAATVETASTCASFPPGATKAAPGVSSMIAASRIPIIAGLLRPGCRP